MQQAETGVAQEEWPQGSWGWAAAVRGRAEWMVCSAAVQVTCWPGVAWIVLIC